jgi:hypothetical protein
MSPGQESIDPYKAPAASSIVAEEGHHSTRWTKILLRLNLLLAMATTFQVFVRVGQHAGLVAANLELDPSLVTLPIAMPFVFSKLIAGVGLFLVFLAEAAWTGSTLRKRHHWGAGSAWLAGMSLLIPGLSFIFHWILWVYIGRTTKSGTKPQSVRTIRKEARVGPLIVLRLLLFVSLPTVILQPFTEAETMGPWGALPLLLFAALPFSWVSHTHRWIQTTVHTSAESSKEANSLGEGQKTEMFRGT